MTFSLRCHLCQTAFPATAVWVCDRCLGPLEVTYDYAAIATLVSRGAIEGRAKNLWRYRELLPIDGEPRIGLHSGCTPLVRADRLAAVFGVRELWVKDDSVNHPTFSYKDRVVSIAATRAVELRPGPADGLLVLTTGTGRFQYLCDVKRALNRPRLEHALASTPTRLKAGTRRLLLTDFVPDSLIDLLEQAQVDFVDAAGHPSVPVRI